LRQLQYDGVVAALLLDTGFALPAQLLAQEHYLLAQVIETVSAILAFVAPRPIGSPTFRSIRPIGHPIGSPIVSVAR
jgi:hypothetical protein